MPGELTSIEDTLRTAYADALEAVRCGGTAPELPLGVQPGRPSRGAGRPGRRIRWVVPVAAGAAVGVIGLVAGLIVPNAMQQQSPLAGGTQQYKSYLFRVLRQLPDAHFDLAVIPVQLATDSQGPAIKFEVSGGIAAEVMAPNGRILYVVTNQGYVTPVDLVKGTAEPPIRIGGSPTDMLVSRDGNTGYVLDRNSLGVSIVDLARHKAAGFIKTPDAWSYALTPDGRTLYVANDTASRITPIDTATRSALPPVTIDGNFPTSPSGGNGEVVVAPDGAAYAFGDVVDAGGFDGFVTPVSTATTTAPKPIVLGFTLINVLGISPDSRTAYIGSESGVAAVSLATGRVMWMARLPATGWITGLPPARGHLGSQAVISPDGQNLYTLGTTGLSSGLLTFYRISATTGAAQTSEVPVGQTLGRTFGSMDIVLSPDGRTLVAEPSARVADSGLPEPLVPIDVATRRAGRFITGGGGLIFGP